MQQLKEGQHLEKAASFAASIVDVSVANDVVVVEQPDGTLLSTPFDFQFKIGETSADVLLENVMNADKRLDVQVGEVKIEGFPRVPTSEELVLHLFSCPKLTQLVEVKTEAWGKSCPLFNSRRS